jgi:hypothetical protein
MAGKGGSIQSVSINGRLFPVAADADTSRKLGGFENEVQANGDGSARTIKTRVPWSLGGLQVEIDEDRADQQFLQQVADQPDPVPMAITYASQATYQGTGTLTDELSFSNTSATATISMMGQGQLTLQ